MFNCLKICIKTHQLSILAINKISQHKYDEALTIIMEIKKITKFKNILKG